MLNVEENRLLTETGPGTPLGRWMREYWVPVARSAQLQRGAAPHRIKIMGERFVAFRSPEGVVGVMDEACPHRGASLALGHNEKCGLRCIYHGWKMAPSGEVLDAPTHPDGFPLRNLHAHARPVHEGQGIVFKEGHSVMLVFAAHEQLQEGLTKTLKAVTGKADDQHDRHDAGLLSIFKHLGESSLLQACSRGAIIGLRGSAGIDRHGDDTYTLKRKCTTSPSCMT